MPRIIYYELKKILSVPVLVLMAATLCILSGVTASRYTGFHWQYGVPVREYRDMTREYAGLLDAALADRALADWRALPDEIAWDGNSDRDLARRNILKQLEAEYAAAARRAAVEAASASPDAMLRAAQATAGWTYPPPVHGYFEGWRAFFESLDAEASYLCALLIVFGLAPLFSGETAAGMVSLCRTFRHGRWSQTAGKLAAAGVFCLLCAVLCVLAPLIGSLWLFGAGGGMLPAAYEGVAYPMMLRGYAALRIALIVLGALSLGAVMALLSSVVPSVTAGAAAGAVVFLAPTIAQLAGLESPFILSLMHYAPMRLFLPGPLLTSLWPVMLGRGVLWPPQWLAILWAAQIPLLCRIAGVWYLRTLRQEPVLEE